MNKFPKLARHHLENKKYNKQTIKTKHPFEGFQVTQSRSQKHEGKNPSPASAKPILRFLRINNQNYRPIGGVRHIFSVQLQTNWRGKAYFQCTIFAFRPFFKASILIYLQILEEADRQHADDNFWLFYGLWSLNSRNSASYIYYGSVFKEVLVFVIMKTKRGLCFRNYEN